MALASAGLGAAAIAALMDAAAERRTMRDAGLYFPGAARVEATKLLASMADPHRSIGGQPRGKSPSAAEAYVAHVDVCRLREARSYPLSLSHSLSQARAFPLYILSTLLRLHSSAT
jgi:hypothetical protein